MKHPNQRGELPRVRLPNTTVDALTRNKLDHLRSAGTASGVAIDRLFQMAALIGYDPTSPFPGLKQTAGPNKETGRKARSRKAAKPS